MPPSSANPPAPDSAPAAEFVQVSKSYPGSLFWRSGVRAVEGVSLRIERGEVFALVGPNRAGKTTLVKLLLSLTQPTSGSVMRLGLPSTGRRTLARVGYVHENHAFPRYLGASELLHCYGALSLLPLATLKERVPLLLERVGLSDRSREPIARFSKGMLQRLGIAQALLSEPDLLVLDEPAEGLDLDGQAMLRDVVAEVRRRHGTVLLVSHSLPEVERLADRVGVLVAGKLVHVGAVAELTRAGSASRSLAEALAELYAKRS